MSNVSNEAKRARAKRKRADREAARKERVAKAKARELLDRGRAVCRLKGIDPALKTERELAEMGGQIRPRTRPMSGRVEKLDLRKLTASDVASIHESYELDF